MFAPSGREWRVVTIASDAGSWIRLAATGPTGLTAMTGVFGKAVADLVEGPDLSGPGRLQAGVFCRPARWIRRSVQRSELAQIVAVGAIGPAVVKTAPSTM